MAQAKTLLTETEVVRLARIDRHFPGCDLNDIRQVEMTAARQCLGKEFYRALVADLQDYSTAATWTGASVTINTVVLYKGFYYKALTTTTREPSVKTDWAEADKFTTAANNDLWCEALGRYLALLVVQNTVPIVSTPVTGQGTIKKEGEGFKAAEEASVLRLQTWISAQVGTAFDNLDDYLNENGFSAYKGYATDTEQESYCSEGSTTERCFEYYPDGTFCCFDTENDNSCSCPKCRQRAINKTNRYVIA
jgi:hypothetical protein